MSVVIRQQPELESALDSDVGEVDGSGGSGAFPGATSASNELPVGAQQ